MKFLFVSLVCIAALSFANAEGLAVVKNHELANILVNLDVLAEAKYPESKGMYVRVVKVQDQGECDGAVKTCPKSILYIAVSSYDEAPDQKVFQTPKGYNWKFDGWENLPPTDKPTDYVILRLSAQKPASTQNGDWQDEHFLYKVNYRNGSWQKQ
jgi:hypothetical protein